MLKTIVVENGVFIRRESGRRDENRVNFPDRTVLISIETLRWDECEVNPWGEIKSGRLPMYRRY